MRVSDFDFHLPDDLIAQHAAPRGTSRLLAMDRQTGAIEHASVADLPRWFRRGDVLVVNNTRVFAARLMGRRVPSGGAVECLLLARPHIEADGSATCDALMHPGQKLKPGAIVRFDAGEGNLLAEVLERKFYGRRRIRLWSESGTDVAAAVERAGHIPLPPYIRRPDTPEDRERYQTVFAEIPGSVAAPTAGLHFTPGILDALDTTGVERVAITLHVGYGTFKPVRTDAVEDHVVDPEPYEIDGFASERIQRAGEEGRRVIAVGTTTTRGLEDAALRGGGRVSPGDAEARIFIYPGFEFRVVHGLMSNFHLPRSSLLMLVCAFGGRERVLEAYREAVASRYRFYSYGDAMLIV